MRVLRCTVAVGLAVATLVISAATGPGGSARAAASPSSRAGVSGKSATASGGDEVVAGVGQPDGYYLFVARSAHGWSWEPVALLDPGGENDQTWIGNTCVTGDGQTAVAVIAPWSASNSPVGIERGGIAYAVNLSTGRTRVLAAGVSMAYFNPGCGAGHDVALTSYLGDAEQTTQVRSVNVLTGAVTAVSTLPGEFTSAVPASGSLLAAHGDALVRLSGAHATKLARLPGAAFQLRPNRLGGVDLLAANSATGGSAWRYYAGSLRQLGTGPLAGLSLLAGHAGTTVLSGATTVARAAGLSTSKLAGSRMLASSQQGTAVLVTPPKSVKDAASRLPEIVSPSGTVLRQAAKLPDIAVPRITATAAGLATISHASSRQSAAAASRQSAAAAQAPACAVGRVNPAIQVPQPSNDQVDWAIQQAVANTLPSRPASFDNLPGGAYSPEADFPQPALVGGSGSSHVPALLVAGILAQESNFDQASWHAPPGTAGDPLIADYYGNGGSSAFINYSAADCGYGLGQITDIMNAGNSIGLTIQQRVAVDYTENIAAVVQLLASTWNQLASYSPSITINNNNPAWLENWYDTVWAYNSGVEPKNSAYGLPASCTAPGPSCTDSAGNWGLGWANNPINPVFKPGRPVFLSDSYADAATPSEWPYQERVFGWMATPLLRYNVADGATEAAYSTADQYLHQPPVTAFCSTKVDNCNPSDPNKLYCQYQASGALQYHCWWHGPVTFAGKCTGATACTADVALSTAASEPSAPNPDPPVCNLDTSQVPISTSAGPTIVVTEESGPADAGGNDINVVGCTGSRNWTAAGSFSVAYATDSQGDPLGQVDFHQLGAGFGGHMYFTHTVPQAAASTSQVTGTWSPGISGTGFYQINAFVPDLGAVADPAVYTVTSSNGTTSEITINQNDYGNQWVSLGDFSLGSNAAVSLTNVTANGDYTSDLAFAAMAFTPEPRPHLLLIHGYMDSCNAAFNSYGSYSWAEGNSTESTTEANDTTTLGYLTSNTGWTSSDITTVGYYTHDYGSKDGGDAASGICDVDLNGSNAGSWADDTVNCNLDWQPSMLPPGGGDPFGTLYDPIMHLACLFAWYIYDTYTSAGVPVEILAHSMGGLITRAAIGGSSAGAAGFPPALLVPDVVSIATPHGGIGGIEQTAAWWVGQGTEELSDMAPGSTFMNTMGGSAYEKPQGTGGTHWALIGSSVPSGPPGSTTYDPSSCVTGANIPASWSLARLLSCLQEGWDGDTYPDGDGVVNATSQMAMPADYKVLYGAVENTSTGTLYIADTETEYEHEWNTCEPIPLGPSQNCTQAPFYLNDGLVPDPTNPSTYTKAFVCQTNCTATDDFSDLNLGSPVTVPHSLAEIASQLPVPPA
jgi:hypothetical protein